LVVLMISLSAAVVAPAHVEAQDDASQSTQNWGPLKALGVDIQPGTKERLVSLPQEDFSGMRMSVPVWIARGQKPGRTLAVTAGIHGDELNGVESPVAFSLKPIHRSFRALSWCCPCSIDMAFLPAVATCMIAGI
jgi:hypothetical protein